MLLFAKQKGGEGREKKERSKRSKTSKFEERLGYSLEKKILIRSPSTTYYIEGGGGNELIMREPRSGRETSNKNFLASIIIGENYYLLSLL
jgi:hypothetical protein